MVLALPEQQQNNGSYGERKLEAISAEKRNELILAHLPQVKLIAKRIRDRLPVYASLDDLISAGVLGLIAAIDRYSEIHDVKLKTYAEYKIRGAILDSLRVMDWAPRQQRKRYKLIQKAISALEQEFQRMPSEEEIAAQLGLSISDFHRWMAEMPGLTLGSLEQPAYEDESVSLLQLIANSEDEWPSVVLERAELERSLAQVIEKLPSVERTVLTLYFYEELTLREISEVVHLHESRISQIKSQAILRLRAYMKRRWGSGF